MLFILRSMAGSLSVGERHNDSAQPRTNREWVAAIAWIGAGEEADAASDRIDSAVTSEAAPGFALAYGSGCSIAG